MKDVADMTERMMEYVREFKDEFDCDTTRFAEFACIVAIAEDGAEAFDDILHALKMGMTDEAGRA